MDTLKPGLCMVGARPLLKRICLYLGQGREKVYGEIALAQAYRPAQGG